MSVTKINNKGQAVLFNNQFLEALTKTRPWVIYAIYIPLNIYFVHLSNTRYHINSFKIFLLFLISMLSWTLVEYLTHRFLFHFEATSKFGKRLVYIFHENHHEYPRDRMRLFMPPLPSLILASLIFGFFATGSIILTGTIAYAFIAFSGFITGYLIYVSMHYAIHAYPPPKYLKALWRNHHLHHYKYPDKSFGVSSNLWDHIFNTLPNRSNTESF